MINSLIQWSLRNRLAVVLISIALLLGGGYITTTLPVDVFPDLTAPTVSIIVEGHGLAPEEMETLVTFPLETAVNGATNVRRVRSATGIGIAVVWVEFDWGTDIHRARQTVTERLATVAAALPETVEPPVLAPVSSIMGEVLFASLSSDRHDAMTLRTTAATQLRRRLLSVAGVSQVTPIGGDEKQYQVVLSPTRLRAMNVSLDDVVDALRQGNANAPGGLVTRAGEEAVVQGVGRFTSDRDIAQVAVAVRGGRPVLIGELGVVQVGPALKRGTASASRRGDNWQPITEDAVIVAIQKQPGANTLQLTAALDEALDEIQQTLPEGMVINRRIFRQAGFIEASIHNTVAALIEGAVMVILIVVIFLASLRSSLITLLAIPMSLVTAFLTLKFTGAGVNTMTLGGLAIAIGALVDDAIIDVENVVRRLRENAALPESQRRSAMHVVFAASAEIRSSIVFATLIIVLVFVPLFFLTGVEGRLLQPLGLAFVIALGASLVTALTLTPALCYLMLPGSATVRRGHEPRVVHLLKRLYAPVLRGAMRHAGAVIVVAAGIVAAAAAALPTLGSTFLPEFNEGALVVNVVTLPGTSLEESSQLGTLVQRTLMQHAEVAAIGRRTGRAEEDEHVLGSEATELEVSLDMDAPQRLGLPRRSRQEMLAAMRADVAAVPGVQVTFGQPISHRVDHMLSGARASIAVKIFGDDLARLRQLGEAVRAAMSGVEGVADLGVEQQALVPMLRVDHDRAAMARFGVHADDINRAMAAATQGVHATTLLEGRSAFDVVVRLDRRDADPAALGETPVHTATGSPVPLRAVAAVREDVTPNFISRENVQRKLVVTCNVAGRDLSSVVADLRRVIADVPRPPGYHVKFGGQFESAEETRRRLAILGVLVVLGVGLLLHIVLRSARDALLVMVNLPLALVGGIVGVLLTGGVVSVASIIGFISVFGIAARNGIMLVSHIQHLQRHENVADFHEAVQRGALERLSPILMTALAAGLALVPLALRGDEPGTEILTPMATVILFGLLSSTLLNMLVVPALYVRFGRPVTRPASAAAPAAPLLPEGA